LRASLTEEPQTLGWPAEITYRFSGHGQHLTIFQDQRRGAQWQFWAETDVALLDLARTVLRGVDLGDALTSLTPNGDSVLAQIRRTNLAHGSNR
jgi:hypothetical protein